MSGSSLASTAFLPRWITAAAVVLALSACGGGGSGATPAPETPATLTLAATSAQVLAGGKPVALTATASANAGTLNWMLGAGNLGTLSATTGATVNYLPPAAVAANTSVTITVGGTGIAKSFALTLYPDPGPAGLSLIAGNVGGYGQVDASGAAARFLPIGGFSSDAQGNLYVAAFEPANGNRNTIRKVTPAGAVSTLIDSVDGYADGPAAGARLSGPTSVAVGPAGTVYVLDENAIRTVSGAGVAGTLTTAFNSSTYHYDPVADRGRDNSGNRIVSDGAGAVYVMERSRISRVSASGAVTVVAGVLDALDTAVDGQGTAARFAYLRDMAIDNTGNLFVVDGFAVRKITPGGLVTTVAGNTAQTVGGPLDGAGAAARFKAPSSLAVDAAGNVLVLDDTLQAIVYPTPFTSTTMVFKALRVVTPAGAVSTAKTGLARVNAVRTDASGRIVLSGDTELSVLDGGGALVALAGKGDDTVIDVDGRGGEARLARPRYGAADSAGTLYVIEGGALDVTGRLDQGLNLRKIATDGTVTTLAGRGIWWGQPGAGNVELTNPTGIAIDRQGNLYISEASAYSNLTIIVGGGTIVKITPDGVASVFAGKHNTTLQPTTRVDGVGEAAVLLNPKMLGFDAGGNLYVDDGAIRKITPDRLVTTVAALPAGFDADADGNVYVREGTTVVRIAANGARTVVAGVPGQPGNLLGALPGSLYSQLYERGSLVRTGPASFAVISGSAILKLALPH